MTYEAMYRAVVVDNADPKGLSRVRLKIPQILGDGATGWAYQLGNGAIPDVGAPVWATFEGGDISFPVYLPALAASGHTHTESDVNSLVSDLASLQASVTSLTTSKASLSGAAFTGNVSTTGTLTATSTISASGLAGSLLSSATPLVNGTAASGTSAIPSRQDHVHPTDTSRAQDSLVVHLAGSETVTGIKTFTGGLSLVTTGEAALYVTGGSSGSHRLSFTTSGVTKWSVGSIGGGSTPVFQIQRYTSAGAYIDAPLQISPSSGDVSLPNALNVTGSITQRSASVPVVTVAGTAPSSPSTGDIWVDSSSTYSPKRMWSGVASVSFSSGTGTLSFGSTLPVAPTTVVVTPQYTTSPMIVTVGAAPTTTGVSLNAWTATVAAGSTVATFGSSVSVHWVAVE